MNSHNHRNRFEFEHLAKSRRNFDQYLENFKVLTSKVSEICDELNLSKPNLKLNESLNSITDERSDDEIPEDLVRRDRPPRITSAEDLKDSESKDVKALTSKVSEIRDALNLIKQDLDVNERLESALDERKDDEDLVQYERTSEISSPVTSDEDLEYSESESALSDGSGSKSSKCCVEQPRPQESYPSNIVYFKVDIHHPKRENQPFKIVQKKDSVLKPEAAESSEALHGVSNVLNELAPNVEERPVKTIDRRVHFETSECLFARAPKSSCRMTSEESLRSSRLQSFLSAEKNDQPRISAKRPQHRETFPSNVIYLSFDVQPKPQKKKTPAFDIVQKGSFFEVVNRPKGLSGTKSAGRRKNVWY